MRTLSNIDEQGPSNRVTNLGYASGNFGKSLQNTTLGLIYLYFLVDVLHVEPALAGLLLLSAQFWDGLTDPTLGYLIDRYSSKHGTYRNIIFAATPLSALAFVALFAVPGLWGGSNPILILISCFIFWAAYTCVDVPHNALLAAISRNSRERAKLAALRFFFSSAASLAVFLIAAPVLRAQSETSDFIRFGIIIAVIYVAVMMISAALTPAPSGYKLPVGKQVSILKTLANLASNRRLLSIFAMCIISAGLVTIFSRMSIFYAQSWLGNPEYASWLLIAHFIGQIVSAPLWSQLSQRFEKKTLSSSAHFLLVATVMVVLSPSTPLLASLFFLVAGIALCGLTVMNWALIPDTIEYTQVQSGERHEATTFGVLTAGTKIASGLGLLAIGWSLQLSGYNSESEILNDSANGIIWTMTTLTALGAISCIAILSRLPISHDQHDALETAKEVRSS